MQKNQELMLKFMESTIEKVNMCLSGIYAIEVALIEKGLITQEEMIARLKEAKNLPVTNVGKQVLEQMMKGTSFEGKSLYDMIDWEKTQRQLEK